MAHDRWQNRRRWYTARKQSWGRRRKPLQLSVHIGFANLAHARIKPPPAMPSRVTLSAVLADSQMRKISSSSTFVTSLSHAHLVMYLLKKCLGILKILTQCNRHLQADSPACSRLLAQTQCCIPSHCCILLTAVSFSLPHPSHCCILKIVDCRTSS